MAPNPPFGAVFTYHLAEPIREPREAAAGGGEAARRGREGHAVPGLGRRSRPSAREAEPAVVLTVSDGRGQVVRRIEGATGKGFHRVAWDLRYPSTNPITEPPKPPEPGEEEPSGVLAAPGRYSVELAKRVDGVVTALAPRVEFDVVPMRQGSLPGGTPERVAEFGRRLAEVDRGLDAAGQVLRAAAERVKLMQYALARSAAEPDLDADLEALRRDLDALDTELNGNRSKDALAEPQPPTPGDRLRVAGIGTGFSTYGPTATHERSLELAEQELQAFKAKLRPLVDQRLPAVEKRLLAAGAPWTPGQQIP